MSRFCSTDRPSNTVAVWNVRPLGEDEEPSLLGVFVGATMLVVQAFAILAAIL